MRVIAGEAKGHTLRTLKGLETRPTLDRVREAVFNVLGGKIFDAVFLDLFSGTGAIGIEALSRGARLCLFNDSQKKACTNIEHNLKHCRLENRAKVFNMDVLKFMDYLAKEATEKFDIIYLDPPYHSGLYSALFNRLDEFQLLNDKAVVIFESGIRTELLSAGNTLELVKKNRYGDTVIWYYQ